MVQMRGFIVIVGLAELGWHVLDSARSNNIRLDILLFLRIHRVRKSPCGSGEANKQVEMKDGNLN
jgi:hypothetical protein